MKSRPLPRPLTSLQKALSLLLATVVGVGLVVAFCFTIPAAAKEGRNNRAAGYRELVLDVANGKERIIPMNIIVSFYTIVDQLERDKTITPEQANEARKAVVRVKKPQ